MCSWYIYHQMIDVLTLTLANCYQPSIDEVLMVKMYSYHQ
jgi:hypothetical protein